MMRSDREKRRKRPGIPSALAVLSLNLARHMMKSAMNSHTRTKAAADWSLHTSFFYSPYSESQKKRKYITPAFPFRTSYQTPISDSSSQRLQSGSFYAWFGLSLPLSREIVPEFSLPCFELSQPVRAKGRLKSGCLPN